MHRRSSTASVPERHDPYAALRIRDFRLLMLGSFVSHLGWQMLVVAVGWEIYLRTRSPFALGIVGLVEVLPVMLLALPAGHAADRFDRRRVVLLCQILLGGSSLGLALLSAGRGPLALVYPCLVLLGAGMAFSSPASSALMADIVPEQHFANAASWDSSIGQLSSMLGPALGGLLIALRHSAVDVYVLNAFAAGIFAFLLALIRAKPSARAVEAATLNSLLAGIGFLRRSPVLLAALTLDLFAVFLGGAVTLMPIFALDILKVGATGLGILQAAPSVGAVLMALVQTRLPPWRRAGRALLVAVACFGLATIIFGLSRSFVLSLVALAVLGTCDNVSVIIRHTLLLTRVPNEMRGRIAAVNDVFIGGSNELGGFESGLAATLFGPILAVVSGGVGTVLVVLLVALVWPELRKLGRLDETQAGTVADGAAAVVEPASA
ncbi:MAG TPA: MFS transporter [Ktedonobacterales bacterium]|nr:MFS transporter [Ktedonobacterales bacterium]